MSHGFLIFFVDNSYDGFLCVGLWVRVWGVYFFLDVPLNVPCEVASPRCLVRRRGDVSSITHFVIHLPVCFMQCPIGFYFFCPDSYRDKSHYHFSCEWVMAMVLDKYYFPNVPLHLIWDNSQKCNREYRFFTSLPPHKAIPARSEWQKQHKGRKDPPSLYPPHKLWLLKEKASAGDPP